MDEHKIEFTIHANGDTFRSALSIRSGVIAGWTGRDPVARDRHIAELEALGVSRPASTPIYYFVSARRFCPAGVIEVSGDESSGEVEFLLLRHDNHLYVGVGSDHTDRKVETYSVTVSKQMCDKPIAPELWDMADVAGHWDRLILRSWATIGGVRELYQEGSLAAMLPPEELIARGFGTEGLPQGTILVGGTFAAKGGIRPASRFEFELEDPWLKRRIGHGYDITPLAISG